MFHISESGEIENGEIRFQLKATDRPRSTHQGGAIAVRIDTRDLQHWSFDIYPIVLIIYDAKCESSYWTFIQDHLDDHPEILTGQQKSATIAIPFDNKLDLASIDRFRERSLSHLTQKSRTEGRIHEPRKPK